MWFFYDLFAAALIAFFIMRCHKRGFLKTVVIFFGYVISAILARLLSGVAAAWIYGAFFREKILSSITEKVTSAGGNGIEGAVQAALDGLPAFLRNGAISSTAGNAAGIVEGALQSTGESVAATIESTVVAPVATMLISSILFFVLFVILLFVVRRVAGLLGFVNNIPLVGKVNKVLGGILGFAQGIGVLYIVAAALSVVIALSGNGSVFKESDIQSSFLFDLFYSFNPLNFITLFFGK